MTDWGCPLVSGRSILAKSRGLNLWIVLLNVSSLPLICCRAILPGFLVSIIRKIGDFWIPSRSDHGANRSGLMKSTGRPTKVQSGACFECHGRRTDLRRRREPIKYRLLSTFWQRRTRSSIEGHIPSRRTQLDRFIIWDVAISAIPVQTDEVTNHR